MKAFWAKHKMAIIIVAGVVVLVIWARRNKGGKVHTAIAKVPLIGARLAG